MAADIKLKQCNMATYPAQREDADGNTIFTPSQNQAHVQRNLNIKIIIDYCRIKKLLPGNAKV